jgi:hypothetical protein
MAKTKEDTPDLSPGVGILIDPDRLTGTVQEQMAPYYIPVRGMRIYGKTAEDALKNATTIDKKEFKAAQLKPRGQKQQQTAALTDTNTVSVSADPVQTVVQAEKALNADKAKALKGNARAASAIMENQAKLSTAVETAASTTGDVAAIQAVVKAAEKLDNDQAAALNGKPAAAAAIANNRNKLATAVKAAQTPLKKYKQDGGTYKKRKSSKRVRVSRNRRH